MSTLKQTLQEASAKNIREIDLIYINDIEKAKEYAIVLLVLLKLFKHNDDSHDLSMLENVSSHWTIPVSITPSPRDVLNMLQSEKETHLDELSALQKHLCENIRDIQNPSLQTLPHIFKATIKKSFRSVCLLFEKPSHIQEASLNIEQLLTCIKRITQIKHYRNK